MEMLSAFKSARSIRSLIKSIKRDAVMLSEAKHLCSFFSWTVAPKSDLSFFASLRMTFLTSLRHMNAA
jgi:hypothetical protein